MHTAEGCTMVHGADWCRVQGDAWCRRVQISVENTEECMVKRGADGTWHRKVQRV